MGVSRRVEAQAEGRPLEPFSFYAAPQRAKICPAALPNRQALLDFGFEIG